MTMVRKILCLLIFISVILLKVNSSALGENGCSIPFGLPFPYKEEFKPACNKHDVCYSCGQIHGWSRAECDSAFHDDMVSICRSRKVKSSKRFIIKWVKKVWVVLKDLKSWALAHRKDRCVKMAKTYYTGVKEFGESHFEERSPDWCERKHAIKRGNPDNLLTL